MPLLFHIWTAIGPFVRLPIGVILLSQAAGPLVESILVLWGLTTRDTQRRAYCERHVAAQRAERMESIRLRRVKIATDHGPYMPPALDRQAGPAVSPAESNE